MKKKRNVMSIHKLDTNEILLKMKLITLLMFVTFVSASASSYSQATKFNLSLKDVTIGDVFQNIEEKSEFVIIFNEKTLDINRKVDVEVKDETVDRILDQIFNGDKDAYKILDRQIAIYPNQTKESSSSFKAESNTEQQKKELSGTVKDDKGNVLPGVTIVIKGTTSGTTTDADGKYTLKIPSPDAVLQFSFIGFQSLEQHVNGKTVLDVFMSVKPTSLDEVVVTAYGTTKRAAITGSIGVIPAATLELNKAENLNSALQGLVPGVQVAAQSGQPGADQLVLIRGIGSFTASSAPLYIVDGIPFDLGPNAINLSDIESISVLKDASAASLYGARAANGVILITTKRGKTDKPRIEFHATVGTSYLAVPFPRKDNINKQWEMVWQGLYNDATDFLSMNDANARQYAVDNVSGAFYNPMPFTLPDGSTRQYHSGWNTDSPIGLDGKVISSAKRLWDFDSYKTFIKPRLKQDYGFNASGSMGEKNKYYISLSNQNDNGAYVGDGYTQYSGRLVLDSKLAKWLDMNNSVLVSSTNNANHPFDVRPFRTLSRENTYYVYDYTTNKYKTRPDIPSQLAIDNTTETGRIAWGGVAPTLYLYDDLGDLVQSVHTISSFTATLMKGLTFKTVYSYQLYNEVYHNNAPPDDNELLDQPNWGDIIRSNTNAITNYFNNVLTYDKTFNLDHHINVFLGHEFYSYKVSRVYAERGGLATPFFQELDEAINYPSVSSGTDTYNLLSYFAKAQYDYKNKYFFNGSYRRDGSSRFAPNERWGNFFSIGGAWIASRENFMKSTSKWLTNLKVKASYGELGNDNIGSYYAYQSFYGNGGAYYGNLGLAITQLANPNIKWETNISTNGGVEFTLFNRLSGSFDVFQRKSKNLLMQTPLPLSTGNSSILRNIGDLQNTGYEAELNYNIIRKKDLNWSVYANASHYTNKITSLPYGSFESQTDLNGNGGVAYYKWQVGGSRYDIYCSDWADVNPQDGRNEWWLYNFDGSGKVIGKTKTEAFTDVNNENQRVKKYSTLPKVYGSFGTNLQYKNFDLSGMFYYNLGGWIYDYNRAESSVLRQSWSVYPVLDKSWKSPGDKTSIAKIYEYYSNTAYSRQNIGSSLWMDKNNFMRLKNLVVGYTLPSLTPLKKIGVEKVRFFFRGENLFTTGYCQKWGTDPESGALWGQNLSGLTYFTRKIYHFGLNIIF